MGKLFILRGPRSRAFVLAAVGIALSTSFSHAATEAATRTGDCALVKNATAREDCFDARAQFFQGDYRLAATQMAKALAASPREGIIRVQLARIILQFGDTVRAERQLRIAQIDGAPPTAVLPVLFYAMVQNHKEITLLNEFPDPPADAKGAVAAETLHGRAMALQAKGQLGDAVASMERSLSLNRTADGLLFRADLAGKQKDAALVKKLVDAAYQLAPDDPSAMSRKLAQLEQANDIQGAMTLADRMIKLYPVNSDPRETKIKIFIKQNQDAKAKAEVDAILAKRPQSYLGQFYNAVLLSRANNKKDSARIVQMLPLDFVRLHPEYAVQMAQLAIDGGHDLAGAQILGAALGTNPDNIDVRIRLAELKMAQNSPQGALLVMTPVQDSNDPRVKKLRSEVLKRIGQDRKF